jgi:hypothetical protein
MRSTWPPASSRIARRASVLGNFFGSSASDRRAGRQNFDATQLAASAARATIVDGVVTTFRGGTGAAVINVAIEYNAGANSGADGGAENVSIATPAPHKRFRQGSGVAIVVDANRQSIGFRYLGCQRKIAPAWKIRRVDDDAGSRIERAGRADPDAGNRRWTRNQALVAARTESMAEITAAKPATASFATIGVRVWKVISPAAFTRPAATLVPPTSTGPARRHG